MEDETSFDDDVRRISADVELWLEQLPSIRGRAREWAGGEDFEAMAKGLHFGRTETVLGSLLMFWRLPEIVRATRNQGLHNPKRRAAYRRLAKSGEVLLALPVIANPAMRRHPNTAAPALVIAPVTQSTRQVVVAGFLGSFLAEIYAAPSDQHPTLSALMADDEYRAWRRRSIPVEETKGFECVAFDIKLIGERLPPETVPFVPILVDPRPDGAFIQIPWEVVAGKTAHPSPPPLPAAPTPPPLPKPAATKRTPLGFLAMWFRRVFFAFLGFVALKMGFDHLTGGGKEASAPGTSVEWRQDPVVSAEATLVPFQHYDPLVGEALQGAGFAFTLPSGTFVLASSRHQFEDRPPSQFFSLDEDTFRVDDKEVLRLAETFVQLVTEVTGSGAALAYDADFELRSGDEIALILSQGNLVRGRLLGADGAVLSKPGRATMLRAEVETEESVAGSSGSPIISIGTGKVVGVMQAADQAEGPRWIEFETLALRFGE